MKDSFDLETKECQAIRKEFGTKSEWLRRLTPVELERLNMFPDNHTDGPTEERGLSSWVMLLSLESSKD